MDNEQIRNWYNSFLFNLEFDNTIAIFENFSLYLNHAAKYYEESNINRDTTTLTFCTNILQVHHTLHTLQLYYRSTFPDLEDAFIDAFHKMDMASKIEPNGSYTVHAQQMLHLIRANIYKLRNENTVSKEICNTMIITLDGVLEFWTDMTYFQNFRAAVIEYYENCTTAVTNANDISPDTTNIFVFEAEDGIRYVKTDCFDHNTEYFRGAHSWFVDAVKRYNIIRAQADTLHNMAENQIKLADRIGTIHVVVREANGQIGKLKTLRRSLNNRVTIIERTSQQPMYTGLLAIFVGILSGVGSSFMSGLLDPEFDIQNDLALPVMFISLLSVLLIGIVTILYKTIVHTTEKYLKQEAITEDTDLVERIETEVANEE